MANSVYPDQTAPIGAVCSGSMLFASILNLLLMLGNYLQQTSSADDIFRCIFFLSALRAKFDYTAHVTWPKWLPWYSNCSTILGWYSWKNFSKSFFLNFKKSRRQKSMKNYKELRKNNHCCSTQKIQTSS